MGVLLRAARASHNRTYHPFGSAEMLRGELIRPFLCVEVRTAGHGQALFQGQLPKRE